jgi:DNA repair ATPase RecN
LKKQQGKKGTAKKKEKKTEGEAEGSTAAQKVEEGPDEQGDGEKAELMSTPKDADEITPTEDSKPNRLRTASLSAKSALSSGPLSPSAGETAQDIYRKQAQRIEELEKENKKLQSESEDAQRRWKKTEEELEELREARGEVAELKSKAGKAEDSADQVEKLVCIAPIATCCRIISC